MPTFVMLTRVAPEALRSPHSLEKLEHKAMARIRDEVPEIKWIHNYAIFGPYDYLDIFSAPDLESAAKVSTLIRSFGRAHSEIWAATEWDRFKEILHSLPDGAEREPQVTKPIEL